MREGVRDIKLYIPVEKLTREFVDELVEVAKHSKGKSQLKFSFQDFGEDVYVSAYARKMRVTLTPELTQFIEKHNLKYTINVNNQ